jgi:PAS domain S-box-containing protein
MLYDSLISKIQVAVVVHGADTAIITSNSKAQELLGLTEAQMLGKEVVDPHWKFTDANGKTLPYEQYPVNQVLISHQELRSFTLGICRSDRDDLVWVSVNADPVFNDEGKIEAVIITFMDITERKKAETLLRESEKRYQDLYDNAPDMFVSVDAKTGYICHCNRMLSNELGFTKAEIIGCPVFDLYTP